MKFNIDLQQIRQFKIIYAWVGNELIQVITNLFIALLLKFQ